LDIYAQSLKAQLLDYAPIAIDYKISKGQIASAELGKVKVKNGKGNLKTRKVYALALPGMPDIDDNYNPIMDADGIITYAKHVESESVNPPAKSVDSKPTDNGHKNGNNKDQGSFEATSKAVDWITIRNAMSDSDKLNRKLDQSEQDRLKNKVEEWNGKGKTQDDMIKFAVGMFKNGKK